MRLSSTWLTKAALTVACTVSAGLIFADTLMLRPDAPDRYVVKKGDTLWAISGQYLASPLNWPTLWGMNSSNIKDPHWIYPGDTLVLDRATGRLSIENVQDVTAPRGAGYLSTIDVAGLRPFLRDPVLIDEKEYNDAPKVMSGDDNRLLMARGDFIYTKRLLENGEWMIVRDGKPLVDPQTKTVLGYESRLVGYAEVERAQDGVSTLLVTQAEGEVAPGDRLIKYWNDQINNFVPHAVWPDLTATVVGTHGLRGNLIAANLDVIIINKGRADGVELGHVFGVFESNRTATVENETITLPPKQSAWVMIYKLQDKTAYGIIVKGRRHVLKGDLLKYPEPLVAASADQIRSH